MFYIAWDVVLKIPEGQMLVYLWFWASPPSWFDVAIWNAWMLPGWFWGASEAPEVALGERGGVWDEGFRHQIWSANFAFSQLSQTRRVSRPALFTAGWAKKLQMQYRYMCRQEIVHDSFKKNHLPTHRKITPICKNKRIVIRPVRNHNSGIH